ncbi:MAG: ATP-binding protein [Flavobacteriales bacterium]|nr:ATP-binding protein [Flavobacteriales bacterium]
MFHQFHRFQKPDVIARETARLKGPVIKVMTITYKPKLKAGLIEEGSVIEDLRANEDLNHILTFRPDGQLAHELMYGSPGEWKERTYEGDNRPLVTSEYKKGNQVSCNTYIYNDRGLQIKVIGTNKGEPFYETTTEYNDAGQVLHHTHITCNHPAHSTIRSHTYDEQGRLLGFETRLKSDGKLQSRITNTYNEKGQRIEHTSEHLDNESDALNYREVYFFNEYGDTVGSDKYNLKGDLVQTLRYGHEFKYDAEGKRIITEREIEEQFTFQDKEDKHGNWIWRMVLEADVPRFVMVRQIQYENDPPMEMTHPLSIVKESTEADNAFRKPKPKKMEPLTDEDIRFIYSQENLTPDQFPLHRYYVAMFKYPPSLLHFYGHIEASAVFSTCEEDYGAKKIFSYANEKEGWEAPVRYVLSFPMYPGYLLYATQLHEVNEDQFVVPLSVTKKHNGVYTSAFNFARPPEDSPLYDEYFEMEISEMMNEFTMQKKPGKPKINLIEVHNNNFTLVERLVQDNFTIRDLDINYGHGFEQFHNDLMSRFNTSSKGLVLFHGLPGTGKTYYIRHLLRQIAVARKSVIYMPPNMVDHLTDPAFMTFLTNSVQNLSRDGQFCVLLIEDAEPLLAKRQEGVRIQGVTNLLNMTDGLLNDMLNLQIICTFNVDLRRLDSALLRPGRLLARKEFKPLSELDANLLAQRLGIKHHFRKPASLGDIYAMLQNQHTLIHDVEPNKDASTQIDDLM